MKVCLGITNVCNILTYLEHGFKLNNIDCLKIHANRHIFEYEKENNSYIKILQYFTDKINMSNSIKRILWLLIREIYLLFIFIYCLYKYDVFIFTYGTSFLRRNLDLPILKFFGRKIIMLYLGSDCRPPYIAGNRRELSTKDVIKLSKKMSKNIKRVEKYADYIINYPPQALFHNKKFILGLIIGLPIYNNRLEIKKRASQKRNIVTILHSPSSPIDKGTSIIRKIIQNLIDKGYNINYVELVNKSHDEVIQNIENCDFVIDQMFSDTPMAIFATEAALYGKPAIVGGYYSKFIKNDIDDKYIPPTEYVLPENLELAILKLINDKDYRIELGKKAFLYVSNQCSPDVVAKKYLKLINDDVPENWYYKPDDIECFYGYGYWKYEVIKRIIDVIAINGVDSLCLSINLKKKILNFIEKF